MKTLAAVLTLCALSFTKTWATPGYIWKANVAGGAQGLVFSRDGSTIFVGFQDKSIRGYSSANGSLLKQVTNLPGPVGALAMSPDGTLLASSSFVFENAPFNDPNARIWRSSDLAPVTVLTGSTGDVMDVDFSPDGTMLVTCSEDGVRVWRTSDWALISKSVGLSTVMRARFIPNHNRVAALDFFGRLTTLDLPSLAEIGHVQLGISSFLGAMAVSPDGQQMVASAFNVITFVNLDTLQKTNKTCDVMQGYDADYSFDGLSALQCGLPQFQSFPMVEQWDTAKLIRTGSYSSIDKAHFYECTGIRNRPGHPKQFATVFASFPNFPSVLALANYPNSISKVGVGSR